jgi:hypothetical protein
LKIETYKTVILHVLVYGSENWSLTLRGEHKLRVFGNRVLRIFHLKGEEVAGGCRRLHNEELYNLYPSPNITTALESR